MESIKTINSPKKAFDNQIYQIKRSIKRGIKKKLIILNQYFLLVLIMILLYERWNFKKLQILLVQLLIIKI